MLFENPETGSIALRQHLLLTMTCKSNLRKFPFDEIECMLAIMPGELNCEYLHAEWSELGVVKAITYESLPDFYIENVEADSMITNELITKNQTSRMEVIIRFHRYCGFFFMQAYVPHILTVAVTGFSFFLNPQSIHARAGFGISTFLAMILQYGALLNSLPKVGYIKVSFVNFKQ